MGTTITITSSTDSVTFTGDGVFAGCTYDKLVGWYGVPAVDLGLVKRPQAVGAYAPTQTFPPEATVSIEGQYFSPLGGTAAGRADALSMRERLSSLYDEGRAVTMTVTDDLRTTSRQILIADVALPWTIHHQFKFTIDAKAPDPRRYGTPQVVGPIYPAAPGGGLDYAGAGGLTYPLDYGTPGSDGRGTVTNTGTADTFSSYFISGGSLTGGFDLVNVATGQRLSYIGDVADGTTVTLDTKTRSAYINGTGAAGRYLANPQFWNVPKGQSLQVQFIPRGATTGTPNLVITTPPAFY